MENYTIVKNTDKYFWYDLSEFKRSNKVLVYNLDVKDYFITTVKACSFNMPAIFEDSNLIDRINCIIIGVYVDS